MEHIIGTDDERIRARARDIWEREGRPEGRHLAHWEQATREIAEEDTALGPDAGLQVPENASARSLREAAEHLRAANEESRAPHPRSSANNLQEETEAGWAGTPS